MDLLVKHRLHGNFTPVKLVEVACGVLVTGVLAGKIWWDARQARKGRIALA